MNFRIAQRVIWGWVGIALMLPAYDVVAEELDNSKPSRIQRAQGVLQKLKSVPIPPRTSPALGEDAGEKARELSRRLAPRRGSRADTTPRRDTQLRIVRATKKRLDLLKKQERQKELDFKWKIAQAIVALEMASSDADKNRAQTILDRFIELQVADRKLEETKRKRAKSAFETARREYRQSRDGEKKR